MSDKPCKGCVLKQFKEIGLIPEEANRLEIVSHTHGVDRCTYYVRGKAYPLTAPSVTVSETSACERPCDDPEIVKLAGKRVLDRNEAAELAAAWVPSKDTDNDPPANGED